jgi:hypothetical protein
MQLLDNQAREAFGKATHPLRPFCRSAHKTRRRPVGRQERLADPSTPVGTGLLLESSERLNALSS